MRVAIHIDHIFKILAGGIGEYTRELVRGLARIDHENYYEMLSTYPDEKDFLIMDGKYSNFNFVPMSYNLPRKLTYAMWHYLNRPGIDRFVKDVDVLHLPSLLMPAINTNIKKVVTICDLAFLRFPDAFPSSKRIFMRRGLRLAVERADKIIAISQHTKDDIVKLTGIDPDKVRVIYLGVKPIYRPVIDKLSIDRILRRYGIDSDYILYVGTLEPRKNLTRLLEAFRLLKDDLGGRYKLVIVGKKGWMYKSIFQRVKELDLEKDIIFTGYLPDNDLPTVISAATLFVYPSIFEGFGLPPLEAMACGTPVVTSNVSSLPEVVGDAAILINPYSTDSIAEGIWKVVSNAELRITMSRMGIERAGLFSWERCAMETLEVYKEVCEGPGNSQVSRLEAPGILRRYPPSRRFLIY